MRGFGKWFRIRLADQRGSVLQENALWIALIVLAAAVVLTALSGNIVNVFKEMQCALGGTPDGYTCKAKKPDTVNQTGFINFLGNHRSEV